MSLFPSTLTGRILDDGVTEPPVIELQGISAGQLATVLTAYTPLETTAQNTADIGTNAAAIAALQGQVAALPAAPDLTPYALASDLAAAEGLIAANASGLTAVNTSLTLGLAAKANQSALDALQVEVDGKSTPASVDLKLSNHPTTAAMNSSIASANNATLASVATTYALKSVVDQLALDVAARQTAGDVAQAIATALLPLVSTSDLTAAVALRTTPADVTQLIATALLPFVQQAAVDAALALRDARLDGHDTEEILALQNAGPFATAGDLNTLQLTLQSAIDGILAEISTLGGATNLVNAPAWLGNVTWDLLAGTNQVRNLHATGPLSIALANDDWTLSFGCDAYTTQQTDDAIAAALTDYFTRAEVTVTVVAAIDESKGYTDTQLADYSTTAEMTHHRCAGALRNSGTAGRRHRGSSRGVLHQRPDGRRPGGGTGVLQHHGPNEPGHRRCAGALRNGGPAGRRHRSGPRGVLHQRPNGCGPRGGPRELLHLGPNGRRHRGGGGAEQRPKLERGPDLHPAAG